MDENVKKIYIYKLNREHLMIFNDPNMMSFPSIALTQDRRFTNKVILKGNMVMFQGLQVNFLERVIALQGSR